VQSLLVCVMDAVCLASYVPTYCGFRRCRQSSSKREELEYRLLDIIVIHIKLIAFQSHSDHQP
jgi:hypothetical protein